MGIAPYLVASSIDCVVAQRLVRPTQVEERVEPLLDRLFGREPVARVAQGAR